MVACDHAVWGNAMVYIVEQWYYHKQRVRITSVLVGHIVKHKVATAYYGECPDPLIEVDLVSVGIW